MSNQRSKVLDRMEKVELQLKDSIEFGTPKMDVSNSEMRIHTKFIANDGVIAINDLIQLEGYDVSLRRNGTGITIIIKIK